MSYLNSETCYDLPEKRLGSPNCSSPELFEGGMLVVKVLRFFYEEGLLVID